MSIWREEEIRYLQTLELSCVELSREYHNIYFKRKTSQNKFKIPAIIIGSFTGVASFGSSTFPVHFQRWISISVGLINVAIAILNTLESFLKLGEELNASKSSSEQLKKLAEDINRELSLEMSTRQTSGVIFLRDSYTRYQQILSTAPVLSKYVTYLLETDTESPTKSLTQKMVGAFTRAKEKPSRDSTACSSMDIESAGRNRSRQLLSQKNRNFSLNNIHDHLNHAGTPTDSNGQYLTQPRSIVQQPPNAASVPPTFQNIQAIAQTGPITSFNGPKKQKTEETNNNIVIEDDDDDDAQSTVSSAANETRLKKLKQLTRTNK